MNPLNPPLVKGEDKKIKIILPFSKGELEGFVEFSLLYALINNYCLQYSTSLLLILL